MAKRIADRNAEAKNRAQKALKNARLKKSDSTTNALRKLDKAMSNEFGREYNTELRPLGIKLSEKVSARQMRQDITGTATVKCTFPPVTCSPDVDG
jgi:hypothetical protein